MKVYTKNNFELEVRIDADCESVDFYSKNGLEASFNAEMNYSTLEVTVEDVRISEQRKGIYTCIIDTILFNDDFHSELKNAFEDEGIEWASFMSVLRSEQACKFWLKRGYGEEYNEHDHSEGQQEVIEIKMF